MATGLPDNSYTTDLPQRIYHLPLGFADDNAEALGPRPLAAIKLRGRLELF